ncbi:hypothetical protein [Thalassovita sp.]|uniref:hypothetical protein n=1 Tax=Thalassovita sp. TaxID=1979401 RepID=UPI002881E5B3|nr:hypothetical protein [Thalassovita sp.]MDF1801660.1 hypothetical protein [Thalassovita sp.]
MTTFTIKKLFSARSPDGRAASVWGGWPGACSASEPGRNPWAIPHLGSICCTRFIVVLSHYMNARTEQAILTESVFLAS